MGAPGVAARWVLTRLAAEPLAWVGGLLLLLTGPALDLAAGWLPSEARPGGGSGPAGEILFLGVLLGAGLAAARLEGLRGLLARCGELELCVAEVVALAIGALIGALPGLFWALCGPQGPGAAPRISQLGAGALVAAHAAALAFLLARAPLKPVARSVALPLLAWALPALLPSEPRAAGVAAWLLDVSRSLGSHPEVQDGPTSAALLAPMILLWAAGAWLGAGAARRP